MKLNHVTNTNEVEAGREPEGWADVGVQSCSSLARSNKSAEHSSNLLKSASQKQRKHMRAGRRSRMGYRSLVVALLQ